MLVYFALSNAKFWRRVHCPTPTPDARYFAFWWNIGGFTLINYCWKLCQSAILTVADIPAITLKDKVWAEIIRLTLIYYRRILSVNYTHLGRLFCHHPLVWAEMSPEMRMFIPICPPGERGRGVLGPNHAWMCLWKSEGNGPFLASNE